MFCRKPFCSKKLILILFILAMAITGNIAYAENNAGGPSGQLKPVLDELVSIITDESLKGSENKTERRKLIMVMISTRFDFREMSRRVLGRTWNKVTPEQQDYFVIQMTKLLENVYIGKLEGYTGQTVEFVEERIKGKRAQVTTMIENGGVKLPVHYIMRDSDANWMVYDINIEGVSLIRNYMEQFKSIIRKKKYEGLIQVIEEKNRFFAEENEN